MKQCTIKQRRFPMGSRINLLRTVRDLISQEGEMKFSASLKLIKEK